MGLRQELGEIVEPEMISDRSRKIWLREMLAKKVWPSRSVAQTWIPGFPIALPCHEESHFPAFKQNAVDQTNGKEQLMKSELSLISGIRTSSLFCGHTEIKNVPQIINDMG